MIGYALRGLVSPWITALAAVAYVVLFFQEAMPWRGDLVWTAGWLGTALIVVAPLTAGAVAVDTARATDWTRASLFVSARSWLSPVLFVYAVALVPVLGGYLVVLGAMLTMSLPGGHDYALTAGTALQPVVHTAAVAFFAAIGSLIGRFTSPVIAALGATAGSVLVLQAGGEVSGTGITVFDLAGAGGSMVGLTFSAEHAVAQITLLVVATALAIGASFRRRAHVRVPTVTGGLHAVGLVVVLALGPALVPWTESRYRAVVGEATDCRGDRVTLCTFAEHDRQRELEQETVFALVDAAAAAGYEALVPDRIVQVATPTGEPPDLGDPRAEFSLTLDSYGVHRGVPSAIDEIAVSLVIPYHCPQLYAAVPPDEDYWEDLRGVVVTWTGLVDPAQVTAPHLADVETLSPGEVAEVMERFATCDL